MFAVRQLALAEKQIIHIVKYITSRIKVIKTSKIL